MQAVRVTRELRCCLALDFYVIRLRANRVLQGRIARLLKRPAGRLPNHVRRLCIDCDYTAASLDKPRRFRCDPYS